MLDFSSQTVDGAAFEGSSLAGRPAVLWFWAPWCPTCRRQIAGVSAAADQFADEVAFVGVGSLDDSEAIDDFAADVPAREIAQLADPDGEVWRHFGITEQSTYVVLDAEGRTVTSGYLDDAELLDVVGDLAGS
ncbi:redoxin domain-containing protein [Nocardioides sp. InS609-2]|uniref:redoxin family protein n=1 Tax=Nocardioides sp. InS609-2 TaxID=2760705 RepID=UPI0020BFD429|nr:redoxin domain-containing protein [Nocardioides sp. InS609-2]